MTDPPISGTVAVVLTDKVHRIHNVDQRFQAAVNLCIHITGGLAQAEICKVSGGGGRTRGSTRQ